MKNKLLLSVSIVLLFLSCDKREDIFAEKNIAPTIEINANQTPGSSLQVFTNSEALTDSFNLVYNEYYINFRTTDESENASFQYVVNNNATITMQSYTKSETNGMFTGTGVLKVVPTALGQHTIELYITDAYSEVSRITLTLNVYLRDNAPVVYLSTVNNVNNHNPTFTTNNIVDTFSFSQGTIILDYKIFDDNSNYVFNSNTTNGGLLVEDLGAKTTTTLQNSVIVTGKLKLTPIALGQHTITITVTDFVGQTTVIIANIFIIDVPAQIFVNTTLNPFNQTSGWVSNFNEKFLMGQGIYQIKYKIIDDSSIPNFSFSSSNFGVLVDDTTQKTTSTLNGITTVEGVLKLTINFAGIHTVLLNVQEFSSTKTSTNTLDVKNNTAPTVNNCQIMYNSFGGMRAWFDGSDVDIVPFNDVVTYELVLEKNFSPIYTVTGVTAKTFAQNFIIDISTHVQPPGNGGSDQFRLKVRGYDLYGGVSVWKISATEWVYW